MSYERSCRCVETPYRTAFAWDAGRESRPVLIVGPPAFVRCAKQYVLSLRATLLPTSELPTRDRSG
ncbi:hypothetical protein BH23GEM8_BH23GEM8_05240 [soil metagenome]